MNKRGIALVLGLLIQAAAQAQDCEAFAHGDDRSMCAALQQKATRFCDDIVHQDKRQMCMAKVQPNSYACEAIKASGLRAECLQYVRKTQASAIYTYTSSKKP
jgi:hypothetical protein